MDKDDVFDKNLASKLDALLAKHRPAILQEKQDFPVLTEIVSAPAWKPPATVLADADIPTAPQPTPHEANASVLNDHDIDALAHQIFSRVMGKLDGDLGTRLEARLTEQLAQQINVVVTSVMADMHQTLANEIGDAVNDAIAEQLHPRKH